MKNYKNILVLLSLVVLIASCSKSFVELNDPNRQTSGSYWNTSDDAIAGVNAIYSTLYYDALYMRIYPWEMDVRADDMYNTSPWWITEVAVYTYTPGNPCYDFPWQYNYIGIFRANQVLTYVPDIKMDESLKTRILGEAKFLRGLFYYHLAILYNNVPIITTLPQGPDDYYPQQATDSAVWKQVISDFTDAENMLPTKAAYSGTNNIGRATKGAAAAFLGKSLMITKQWSKAEAVLKDIVDQKLGSYSLVPDYRDNFRSDPSTENNSESLFEVQFDKTVGGTTLGWAGEPDATWSKTSGKARTYAPLPGFGYGDITPTDWIYLEFQKEKTVDSTNDPRMEASLFFPHPGDTTYTVYGKTWAQANLTQRDGQAYNVHVRKYLNDETDPDEIEWRSAINERIMRYSDVLLMYAECLNELGRTGESYQYIQEVRDRANLPDLATKKPGMTQDQMRDQIAHERALELCFEAQRYTDILRWGWITNSDKRAMLEQHDPEFGQWTPGREIFPIPAAELNSNKNLVQNPGWSN